MRLGVIMMPTDPWPDSVATARRLDELGYDHLWVYDHLTWRRFRDEPWFGIYPWLTGIAAATERIRVGTVVSNPNLRHPSILAKDAMTIDHISNGRLVLGVGAGGLGYDAVALGQEPLTPKQRIDRLSEYVPLLRDLLRGELTDHSGDWYTVNGARMLPGCVQNPSVPVAVAAGKRRGIALAAAEGDAWITNGDPARPDLTVDLHRQIIAEQVELFNKGCVDADRDPDTVDRYMVISNAEARPLRSIDAFTEDIEFYRSLGFTDVLFHHPRPDDPDWNDPVEMVDEIAERFFRNQSS